MFTVGQSVNIVGSKAVGVVAEVSDWEQVNGKPSSGPCYFVRVQSWDNCRNGGRWLDESVLADLNNDVKIN